VKRRLKERGQLRLIIEARLRSALDDRRRSRQLGVASRQPDDDASRRCELGFKSGLPHFTIPDWAPTFISRDFGTLMSLTFGHEKRCGWR